MLPTPSSQSPNCRWLLVALLAAPMLANSEAQRVVSTGKAVSRLDFKIVVPRVAFLAVGMSKSAVAVTAAQAAAAGASAPSSAFPACSAQAMAGAVCAMTNRGPLMLWSQVVIAPAAANTSKAVAANSVNDSTTAAYATTSTNTQVVSPPNQPGIVIYTLAQP